MTVVPYGSLARDVQHYCEEPSNKTKKFTPRDLRRTCKTLTGAAGLSKEIRDRLQGHALQDVSTRHYDRYDYLAEKRDAVQVWDDYLRSIIAGEPERKVVQLKP